MTYILIFSKSAEQHVEHVKTVMEVLQQHSILIKMSKCTWDQTELPYLGRIVSKDGNGLTLKRFRQLLTGPNLPTSLRFNNSLA